MKRFLTCVGLVSFLTAGALFAAESPKELVRVDGLSLAQVRAIGMKGYDVAKAGRDYVEVVVTPQELKSLPITKTTPKVLIPDMDAYIAGVLSKQVRGAAYFTYDTMTAALKDMAQKYPNIARLSSIGKSIEGREIWAVKVSNNPDKDQKIPAALIMGAHHSREWISDEVPMEALKQMLAGYGKDETLTRLVNTRETWFVPMVNPDGITYSQTKSKYWRKNRRKVDANNYGVDPNRNYGWHWGNVGASSDPSQDTYHGTGPFSEPETSAIKALAEREHFQASISFHSYSELVLYPFGYGNDIPCSDTATLSKLAGEMASFNHYTPENSATLYPAMGDSDDWLYGSCKTLAFTIELATEFIPSPDKIAGITALNVPAVFHLIDKAGTYGLTTPTGDASLASHVDAKTALAAISDGTALSASLSEDSRIETGDRIQAIGRHLAELTAAEMAQGNSETWEQIKNTPAASFVKSLVRDCLTFSAVHGDKVDPALLNEVSSTR
ncbi:MAG: zinc carboxypeptidase [Candidatus Riflebacteria bacterium]|nr:zinc carboxypeptidase [Candidatus Riflebacteria bacterium]